MSDHRRIASFCVATAVLTAGAGLIVAHGGGGGEQAVSPQPRSSPAAPRDPGGLLAELRRGERAEERAETYETIGNPTDERDKRGSEVRRSAGERRAAAAVARRFLRAFSRHEIGRGSLTVERELRASTTAAFARELLAAEPRLSLGAPPPLARPRRLQLVPGKHLRGELVALEFVATIDRAGERTALAISMRRDGGWLVDALGR